VATAFEGGRPQRKITRATAAQNHLGDRKGRPYYTMKVLLRPVRLW
jgi:hypothetical protein